MTENLARPVGSAPQHALPAAPSIATGYLPELMLLLVAAVWGGSYAVTKQITVQVAVLEFLAIRFGVTALLLTPALRAVFHADWRKSLTVGAALGSTLFAIFLCETFGVSMTSATNAAFLISLCVVLTPFAEWLILGTRPSPRMMLAALVCVAGAVLMIPGSLTRPFDNKGDWLMLGAAVLRALMVTLTKRLSEWHKVPALTQTAMQSVVVFLGALCALYMHTGTVLMEVPGDFVFWQRMGFLVVCCTVFAFFAQNYASVRSTPSRVAFLMGSEPVFGAFFGAMLMHESLTAGGAFGACLIVLATGVTLMGAKKGAVAGKENTFEPAQTPASAQRGV